MMTVMATLLSIAEWKGGGLPSEMMAELWVVIFFLVFCDDFADNGDW